MRPELKKQILRTASAYKLARHIVDGFVLAELAVVVVAVVWVCLEQARQPEPNKLIVVAACCGAVVVFASALFQREFFHSIFDIADCALAKHDPHADD